MSDLTFITKKGSEIGTVFDDLAKLRIAVFRSFPYLYEGSVEYEKTYLQTYVDSDKSFLFAVYDGKEMVGATTCVPLIDEMPEIKNPLHEKGYSIEKIFYFGESILLKDYRGKGLGHRFFDEREGHARSFGTFEKTCFFSVLREEDHPAIPHDYRTNDAFWQKKGYEKHSEIQSKIEWPDIGEGKSTAKTLVCWMKNL
jgi:GNAT superfamily N-acetyltransferase